MLVVNTRKNMMEVGQLYKFNTVYLSGYWVMSWGQSQDQLQIGTYNGVMQTLWDYQF